MGSAVSVKKILQVALGLVTIPAQTVHDEGTLIINQLFPQKDNNISPLIDSIASDILRTAKAELEYLDSTDLSQVSLALFEGYRLTTDEILNTDPPLDANAAAKLICKKGRKLLVGADPNVRVAIENWLAPAVYGAILETRFKESELLHRALAELLKRKKDAEQSEIDRAGRYRKPSVRKPVIDFVGRKDKLTQIRGVLIAGDAALICATHGMGGVGKTQLALKAADQLSGEFYDGQVIVDLQGKSSAPLSAETAMAEIITTVMPGATLPPGVEALGNLYRQTLHKRRLLLILDNVRDVDQIRQLVPEPPTALIVTSREKLVLPGAKRIEVDVLSLRSAMQMLQEVLGPADEELIERLAEACACLPLALRAAASCVVSFGYGIEEYIGSLRKKRLEMLSIAKISDTELDVQAVLQLSRDRIEESDHISAACFDGLSVFPADFDVGTAAVVWGIAEDEARLIMGRLQHHSLVLRLPEDRFFLHDIIRDVADVNLHDTLRTEAKKRFTRYFVELADRILPSNRVVDVRQSAAAILKREFRNIDKAFRDGLKGDDAVAVAELVERIFNFLAFTGRGQIDLLDHCQDAYRRAGEREGELAMINYKGLLALHHNQIKEAEEYFAEGIERNREVWGGAGSRTVFSYWREGNCWAGLCQVSRRRGNLDRALQQIQYGEHAFRSALESFKKDSNSFARDGAEFFDHFANALMNKSDLAIDCDGLLSVRKGQSAREALSQGIRLYRRRAQLAGLPGAQQWHGRIERRFGDLNRLSGNRSQARKRYQRGWRNGVEFEDIVGVARCALGLTLLDLDEENWEAAASQLQQASDAFGSLHNGADVAFCTELQGAIAQRQWSPRPPDKAERRWDVSIPVFL